MATYVYYCGYCDLNMESEYRDRPLLCWVCEFPVRRNWKAESANVNIANLKEARS